MILPAVRVAANAVYNAWSDLGAKGSIPPNDFSYLTASALPPRSAVLMVLVQLCHEHQ